MNSVLSDVRGSDAISLKTNWRCEKWSEEAVDFVRHQLTLRGITHAPAELVAVKPVIPLRLKLAEKLAGRSIIEPVMRPRLMPITEGISSALLRKIVGEPEEVVDIESNLLLNEGIQRALDLVIAAGGVAYNNANAYIGVGDSATAEAATQTDLQAASNHFYKAMNATFPSRASQTVTWQSDFTSAEANYVWAEWSISAGATSASGSGFLIGTTNLNRKVQALGTKATGTWTLSGQVTLS